MNNFKKIKILTLFSLSLILLIANQTYAQDIKAYVEENSKILFDQIDKNKSLYSEDPNALMELVDKSFSQYFHFEYMSRFVAGKYWRRMTEPQQKEFSTLFKQLLLTTYIKAILNYSYKDLTFMEVKPSKKKNRYWLAMQASKDGESITINYNIAKTKSGLKIINVKAEGISLLINYRKSFANVLSKKDGIQQLLTFLRKKTKPTS